MEDTVMILSEVAEYLKFSEKTILKMAKENRIPCTRIGNQWRFYRPLLDKWLVSGIDFSTPRQTEDQLSEDQLLVPLSRLYREELTVLDVEPGSRVHILRQLIKPVLEQETGIEGDDLLEGLYERERLNPTAVGHGIAIPHLRTPSVQLSSGPSFIVGICPEGTDFKAPDGKPVRLFFLILTQNEKTHIRILSRLMQLCRDENVCTRLVQQSSARGITEVLLQQEYQNPGKREE